MQLCIVDTKTEREREEKMKRQRKRNKMTLTSYKSVVFAYEVCLLTATIWTAYPRTCIKTRPEITVMVDWA